MYNEKWTIEKHKKYRKLKRSGYSDEMLIEHFGEDIYYSGLYNRKSTIMPFLGFITEITITPEFVNYNVNKNKSIIYINKFDYVINFIDNDIKYIICLFYYVIEEIETYNVLFTTENQWIDYENRLNEIGKKGYVTDLERIELANIVEKGTGFNNLFSIMKKISYILSDFIKIGLINVLSIGETRNIVKINLYRNIIRNSFKNIKEIDNKYDEFGNKYFLYSIEKV